MKYDRQYEITVCSDSLGETAESVVRATIRQFNEHSISIKRVGHIKTETEIRAIMQEAAQRGGFVAYTLVQRELREAMKDASIQLGVKAVDIMGPMMEAFTETFNDAPRSEPGLLHQLDEQYFRRVEAIEFAVRNDDGKDASALLKAQIVLVGVSRTSKTPLSIYLAHKGMHVANLPLVPEVKLPRELFLIPGSRVVGLTMDAEKLLQIRTERLKAAGLAPGAKYAALERIVEELDYSKRVMSGLGCLVINVTNKAIEETAGIIMGYVVNA